MQFEKKTRIGSAGGLIKILIKIILINIPKIPFGFPILVFFSNCIYCKYFQNKTYLWFFNKELWI